MLGGGIETFLVAAHDVSAGNLATDEQIGVCYFCDAASEIVDCATSHEARAALVRVLKSVWAAEIRPYIEPHCVDGDGDAKLERIRDAWDKMVKGIYQDGTSDSSDVLFSCSSNRRGQLGRDTGGAAARSRVSIRRCQMVSRRRRWRAAGITHGC